MAERDTIITELKLAGQRAYAAGMASATGSVERFDDRVGLANRRLWNMGGMATRTASIVTSSLVGIGAAATAVGASMALTGIKFNAQLESMSIGFESMLGSEKAAEGMMDRILRLSKKSPFEFAGISTGVQQLVAMGVSGDTAVRTIKNIGNALAASGKGTEELQRASVQLAQMQAFGQATREDLRSLTEAGVPAFKLLKKELGLTGKELDQKLRKGALSGADAIGAINRAVEKDPTISKLMQKQSKSLAGQWSTLRDNWKITLGLMTQDASNWIARDFLPSLNRGFDGMQAVLRDQETPWELKWLYLKGIAVGTLGPLWDDVVRKWEQQDMSSKAVGIGQDIVAGIARGATTAAPRVVSAFWQGFKAAPFEAKATLVALVFGKVFTGALVGAAGTKVAGLFLGGFSDGVTGKRGGDKLRNTGSRMGRIMGPAMGAAAAVAMVPVIEEAIRQLEKELGIGATKPGSESERKFGPHMGLFEKWTGINLEQEVKDWLKDMVRGDPSRWARPRALGGPVLPSVPYVVGERGPELFIPKMPGTIYPETSMAGLINLTAITQLDGRVLAKTTAQVTADRMARR